MRGITIDFHRCVGSDKCLRDEETKAHKGLASVQFRSRIFIEIPVLLRGGRGETLIPLPVSFLGGGERGEILMINSAHYRGELLEE